ncbi:MAG: hypothetical protein COB53_10175 [Elusimicrobia bacterium]|nr:MAG: hypothetical protein COB53_10175 [Elusimicrobiota bacterium]
MNKTTDRQLPDGFLMKFENALEQIIIDIPTSSAKKSSDPAYGAKAFSAGAARDSALLSGTLSIIPGPAAIVTIFPDLLGVWRLQAQLVSDIAAAHGKSNALKKEVMMVCLFDHVCSDAMKDILARGGERIIVSSVSQQALAHALHVLTGTLIQRILSRVVARWIPIVGAGALAAYSYNDTKHVGKTAQKYFSELPK